MEDIICCSFVSQVPCGLNHAGTFGILIQGAGHTFRMAGAEGSASHKMAAAGEKMARNEVMHNSSSINILGSSCHLIFTACQEPC